MSILDGFQIFNFNEGVPYASVTNNGLTFNKAVVMKLGYPEYALLLFDRASGRMALQVCDKDTPNAAEFYRPKKSNVISVRWNSKDLLNTIEDMMGWNLEIAGYRVEGALFREEKIIIFDLNAAKIMK